MTDRKNILERIWQNKPEQRSLPDKLISKGETKPHEEILPEFIESLKKAGAEVREFDTKQEATEYIDKSIHNAINILKQEIKAEYLKDISKEELEKINVLIAEGQFGVAENGAIWLDESDISNRLLPFITQQLLLVLDRRQIVSTMHQAYQRIKLSETEFGAFISGPSKTADIEQSLVYGAHGAKTLIVILF